MADLIVVRDYSAPTIMSQYAKTVYHWALNEEAVHVFGDYLASDLPASLIKYLEQIFAFSPDINPNDYILACRIYPFNVSSGSYIVGTGARRRVRVGKEDAGHDYEFGHGVNYVDGWQIYSFRPIRAAKFTVTPKYEATGDENYLNYAPYATYTLYLPFIGEVDLPPAEIVGKDIVVEYVVDINNGDCCAIVSESTHDEEYEYLRYITSASGHIAVDIPFVGQSSSVRAGRMKEAISGMLSTAVNVAAGVSMAKTSEIAEHEATLANIDPGRTPLQQASAARQTTAANIRLEASKKNTAVHGLSQMGASMVNLYSQQCNPKELTSVTGTNSGGLGFSCPLKVKLYARYRKVDRPLLYNKYRGKPCNMTMPLTLLWANPTTGVPVRGGFTIFSDIHLENLTDFTLAERQELESILKSGVIF